MELNASNIPSFPIFEREIMVEIEVKVEYTNSMTGLNNIGKYRRIIRISNGGTRKGERHLNHSGHSKVP